ncbi:MAG: acetyltransferase [Thermoplasmata archaeon]|nr:MAG: acetyltransferase [Thermoplasmata archaeon]RLF50146.1 MAG: acetyltransferase [Thermoplasmata archaeon]
MSKKNNNNVSNRKRELDRQRNEWRKKHRILNGKIILWPDKPPEHVNARASKTYNWFWREILLKLNQHDIPAVIANIKGQINSETSSDKIRVYRTMIGMAEDAYQLKNLEDIMDYDQELQFSKKPVYNSEQGIIYKDGKIFTTDYSEDETEIIVRDIEGVIIDRLSSGNNGQDLSYKNIRNNTYKNWIYTEGK